jgi:hypothetical protein
LITNIKNVTNYPTKPLRTITMAIQRFKQNYQRYITKCTKEEYKMSDHDYADWRDVPSVQLPYKTTIPTHVPPPPHKESLKLFRREIIHKYLIERAWVVYESRKLILMVKRARDQFAMCLPQYELWNARLDMIVYPGLHNETGMIVLDALEGSLNHVEVELCKIKTCKRLVDIYAYLECVYPYMRYRAYHPRFDRETLQNTELDDLIYDEIRNFYIT